MAQSFVRQNSTPQRFIAENLAVSVPLASNTTLLDMVVEGAEKLSVQVDNTIQALDAFVIQGRVHRNAAYITFASAASDFTTPTATNRLLTATGAPVTLAAGASAYFGMDVSGLYSVKILASGGNATDSVVSIYAAGGQAAGTPNANINATINAGTNLMGKVGIDQTTPGTTNQVSAAQNGTWTVQPGNTANTTAWKVDGSAVTQPVSGTFYQATQPVSVPAIADCVKVSPVGGSKAITTSGTAEALVAGSTMAISLYVRAKAANTGAVCLGDSAVDKTTSRQIVLVAGQSVTIDARVGQKIDVNEFYADVDVSAEGVDFLYVA